MKLSRITLAMAAACGAMASAPSFGITASNYSNTGEFTGDTLNIRISGASAQDAGVLGSALSLCVAGTVHRYAISNNFAFFCNPDIGTNPGQIQVPARAASLGGPITKLAIYKYAVGGSAFGVEAVESNSATDGSVVGSTGNLLPFLDLAKINSSLATATNAVTSNLTFGPGTNGSYVNVLFSTLVSTTSVTTPATTYIGLSDVEPAFFSNNTVGLTATPQTALIFGPIVSKNVYDRLQTLQGLTAPGCGATLESEGCMPSLTSAQITSLYTQPGQAWSTFGITGLANDSVYIARRVDSSGTQKVFEAVIAGTPNGQSGLKSCQSGVDSFALPDSGTTSGDPAVACTVGISIGGAAVAVPTVFAGSGGGDVRACLIAHQANGRSAIGILTTEDKPTTANNWRFVKVDGVAPNQANTAAGRYRFYTETSFNTRSTGTFATASQPGYTAFVNRLKADLANPTILAQVNGADQTYGKAGLMALLSLQAAGTVADFTGASSDIPWTKTVGAAVNNCQRPKLFN